MDAPEKRHTQTGMGPESRNVNPNRLTKTTSAEHDDPPGPAGPEHGCSPPVMETTSSVLGSTPPHGQSPWAGKRVPPGGLVRGVLRLAGGTGESPRRGHQMSRSFWWCFGLWMVAVGLVLMEYPQSAVSPGIAAGDLISGFGVMGAEEWRRSRRLRWKFWSPG